MEYAGLEHDAVVVGQGGKFEIWDQARFKALLSQDFDDVADELAESGIEEFPFKKYLGFGDMVEDRCLYIFFLS